MSKRTLFSSALINSIKKLLSVSENKNYDIGYPKKILVVRQHNQFGDLLASVPVFRALKETIPPCNITLIVSPENYYAITKNIYIDEYFVFNKQKVFNPFYLIKFWRLLRRGYDATLIPVTVSISFTSLLIARISKTDTRIGPGTLSGKKNKFDFLLDRRVNLDWRKKPDSHVADFCVDLLRPFGITTKSFTSNIAFNNEDLNIAMKFLSSLRYNNNEYLIGMHVGAGKPPNRWDIRKFTHLIQKLYEELQAKVYITGSTSDIEQLNFLHENLNTKPGFFINRKIPEIAALISKSDLFITNDTGIMHVAGATKTPEISLFGPTNPYNWAPIGANKFFIRKSDLIEDISVNDVYSLCKTVLVENTK